MCAFMGGWTGLTGGRVLGDEVDEMVTTPVAPATAGA